MPQLFPDQTIKFHLSTVLLVLLFISADQLGRHALAPKRLNDGLRLRKAMGHLKIGIKYVFPRLARRRAGLQLQHIDIPFGKLLEHAVPVSYTHLDVYKRQTGNPAMARRVRSFLFIFIPP